MTFDELKSRLRNVQEHGTNKITASCPNSRKHSNDDKSRSFSATYDSNSRKILVHCHTGCSIEEICGALGCGIDELMPEPTEQERQRNYLEWYAGQNSLALEAVYSYCYGTFADGLAKIRFRTADGKKDFRWMKNDSARKSGFSMTHNGCPHRLYVRGDLEKAARCFLVEGEKDVDNLYSLTNTPTVCAENGAGRNSGGGKWREEYTAQLEGKDVYILWDNDPKTDPDNDPVGLQFAKIEAQALEGHAARLFMLDITAMWPDCPEHGDISDMIQAIGRQETAARLRDLIQATPERPQTAQEAPQQAPGDLEGKREAPAQEATQNAPQAPTAPRKTPVELFDSFMEKIQTPAYEPVKTGMPAFDRLLRGGIPRQSLVILSAAPGTGKTTLAQQVFEAAAAHGTDVIFLNLEMSREQLLARSISRLIHRDGGNISANEILRGYEWTDAQRRYIEAAAAKYRAEIAPQMQYNPDGSGTGIDSIMETLNGAAQAAKAAGRPAPVCVLDYLHLVTAEPGQRADQQEIIKKTVANLKRWAIEHNTYVFAISANNRAANSSGVTAIDSARDSSAIEYTADIQLSLNYRALHEHSQITYTNAEGNTVTEKAQANNPDHMEALQQEKPRHMMVQVLKNRMTEPGGKLYLDFHAANSEFIPVDTRTDAPTPPPAGWRVVNDPDMPFH